MKDLLDRKNEFDRLLIETTGIADPLPFLSELMHDKKLNVQLNVVTVIDSYNIQRYLKNTLRQEIEQQIAVADIILLNKIDSVSPEESIKLNGTIKELARPETKVQLYAQVEDIDLSIQ